MGALERVTLRIVAIALAVLAGLGLATTRFVPEVVRVEVSGHDHYAPETIADLADVAPGDPFLWVTGVRARRLATDPWIARARILRHWPDTISLHVWEREPVLTDGVRAWALDGTELPDPTADELTPLPRLEGWGPPRTEEALALVDLLGDDEIRVISYSPEGFSIELADGVLLTPSPEALRDQWAAYQSQPGRRIAVYPWGVSRLND